MAETRLEKSFVSEETAEAVTSSAAEEEKHQQQTVALEHEIECPRCRDAMTLCSDFDNLYYFCEECDFCLYTIKK